MGTRFAGRTVRPSDFGDAVENLCIIRVKIRRMIILVSLAAALAFALSQICVRLGLRYCSPTTAVTCTVSTMAPLVWLILGPAVSWDAFSLPGTLWLMLAGAVAPLGTQILLFASTLRIGIARASPLRNTSPLFASLLAISFLGETWTVPVAAGTVSIVVGASLLGIDKGEAVAGFQKRYLWMALASGLLGGFSDPMRKFGLTLITNLPLAICSLMAGSLVFLTAYLMTGKYREITINRHALKWFLPAGAASALGVSTNLLALSMGDVVVVTPLVSTVPLFTVFFSFFFLKHLEKVTVKLILGALAICLGGALLGVFR